MTYFAALLARHGDDWKARELDLDNVGDLDALADLMVDAAPDDDEPVLLLVEQEDEWFALVRIQGADGDPRVFVSDVRAAAASALGQVLLPAVAADVDAHQASGGQDVGSGPDSDVVDDLGMGEDELLDLCTDDVLPADALSTVAEKVGCLDALERLR